MSLENGSSPTTALLGEFHQPYELIVHFSNEAKAASFGVVPLQGSITATEMARDVTRLQGPNPIWQMSNGLAGFYAKGLEKAGLLDSEAIPNAQRNVMFSHTRYGKLLGIPTAGHLLGLSAEVPQSLIQISGPIQNRNAAGERPCQRRFGVMALLNSNDGEKLRTSKVAQELGVTESIMTTILDRMASADIIRKSSSGKGKAIRFYTAEDSIFEVDLSKTNTGQLFAFVLEIIQFHTRQFPDVPFSNLDVVQILKQNYGYAHADPKLSYDVARITRNLAESKGALKPLSAFEGKNTRALVWTTPEQRKVINKILAVVDGVIAPTDDFLALGKSNLRDILANQDLFNSLISKAKDKSPGFKAQAAEQQRIRTTISNIVHEAGKPMTGRQIQEMLHDQGEILGMSPIRTHLRHLAKNNGVSCTETPVGILYEAAA